MSDKKRFPRAIGLRVAEELSAALAPFTERLLVAGSLRREKPDIGDVEILFIPVFENCPVPGDMFASVMTDLAAVAIGDLIKAGVLAKRLNVNGSEVWGEKNKLAVHLATGLPVDLFSATESNWWNQVVCRTGSAESNLRICNGAIARGWRWNPYGAGFTSMDGANSYATTSEEDVFRFAGLPFKQPKDRV